jgi:gluconolactonase
MIVAESDAGRISRTDPGTGKSEILAALYGNRPFNSPNDVVADAAGRIYFTDPRYGDLSSLPQPLRGVYRLDTNGTVTLLIGNISMPNGVAVSPDQSTLYVGCYDEGAPASKGKEGIPETMALLAYDLDRNGNVRFRKTIARYGKGVGPDGLTVDRDGNLYAALRDESRPGIAVYSPSGGAIGFIPTPEVPSNVAFDCPPHDDRLYVTAGGGLYRIRLTKRGYFVR